MASATKLKKQDTVKDLEKFFTDAKVAVVTDVSGFTVAELTKLRRLLGGQQSKMRVAKNTLIKIATKSTEYASIDTLTKGPSAVVVGYQDQVQAAKTVVDYFNELKKGVVRGGILDGIFQELLHPLLLRRPRDHQINPVASQVTQLTDRWWWDKTGPQHLAFGDLAQPHRVQSIRLGPPR